MEHRFIWKDGKVDCQECSTYFTLGFSTCQDDEKFRKFLNSGGLFKRIESVDSYYTEPRFSLWILHIGSKYVQGGELFRCKKCQQEWAYSDADYAWRGYFRPIAGVKPKTKAAREK